MANKNISIMYCKQPRYYSRFACMGGSCPVSCCLSWRVVWSKEEVDKLKNAECSDKLRADVESSFVPFEKNSEKFSIKMVDNGRCPFLTEDNFCSIQRELGAEYLSYTCSIYPRHSSFIGDDVYRFCNLSCFRVMDSLCNDSECMILDNYHSAEKTSRVRVERLKQEILDKPGVKYRQQIFEFFYDIISDDSHSVETSLVFGALVAQSLSKLVSNGESNKIPSSIDAFRAQIKDPNQIKNIENIKPNYEVKFKFLNELNKQITDSNIIDLISEDGLVVLDKYNEGMKRFSEDFADRPFALRNIALNLLLELKMPFISYDYNLFENYCYYVAAFAIMKLIAYSIYAAERKNPEFGFKISSVYADRFFSHNLDSKEFGTILDIYKKFNFLSPAYLALIVK